MASKQASAAGLRLLMQHGAHRAVGQDWRAGPQPLPKWQFLHLRLAFPYSPTSAFVKAKLARLFATRRMRFAYGNSARQFTLPEV